VIYDVTNRASFDGVREVVDTARDLSKDPNTSIMIMGNKSDMKAERAVSHEEGQNLAHDCNAQFLECSAKTGEGVSEAFEAIARAYLVSGGKIDPADRKGEKNLSDAEAAVATKTKEGATAGVVVTVGDEEQELPAPVSEEDEQQDEERVAPTEDPDAGSAPAGVDEVDEGGSESGEPVL